eukprot:TRINITY_DN8909_c0_g1_i1.p1 TRINITY_DN8909_c0_g1~~TRINITY_DN8909_c0_g1_i1.p1  ORF type:complete len:195 (+),score=11.37 TRINITY_DN8909_c0_g1_i1:66-587(+)
MSVDRGSFPCPEGWLWEDEWAVVRLESTDNEGFVYATSFKGPWRQVAAPTDVVRRRMWVRQRARKGVGPVGEVDKLRQENRALREQVKSQAEYIQRLLTGMAGGDSFSGDMSTSSSPDDPSNTLHTAVKHGCTDVAHLLRLYDPSSAPRIPASPSHSSRISEMEIEEGSSPGF